MKIKKNNDLSVASINAFSRKNHRILCFLAKYLHDFAIDSLSACVNPALSPVSVHLWVRFRTIGGKRRAMNPVIAL